MAIKQVIPSRDIHYHQRVLFVGKTGSGKTFLARILCAPLTRLIVIDGKGDLIGENSFGTVDYNPAVEDAMMSGKPFRARITIPPGIDALDYLDDLFQAAFVARNLTIYIDEIYSLVPPRKAASPWFNALYQRGRGFGIGMWTATQRPVYIPGFIYSESEWFFMFRLSKLEDRRRMADAMGNAVLKLPADRHGFWVYNIDWDSPAYFKRAVVR